MTVNNASYLVPATEDDMHPNSGQRGLTTEMSWGGVPTVPNLPQLC